MKKQTVFTTFDDNVFDTIQEAYDYLKDLTTRPMYIKLGDTLSDTNRFNMMDALETNRHAILEYLKIRQDIHDCLLLDTHSELKATEHDTCPEHLPTRPTPPTPPAKVIKSEVFDSINKEESKGYR